MSASGAAAQPVQRESDALGVLTRAPGDQVATLKPAPITTDAVARWSGIAVDASGIDHTPVAPGETRTFGEQLGPARASRAMAMVHVAMLEALNALTPTYVSYLGMSPEFDRGGRCSGPLALAQAAHDTLVALFPSQTASFDLALAADVAAARPNELSCSTTLGRNVAQILLRMRAGDGSATPEPLVGVGYTPGSQPGQWRPDPISQVPVALGALWKNVTPFVLSSADQFRCPAPPSLDSAAYAQAYEEVKRVGGDGKLGGTPTQRSPEQEQIGVFWAYDGTPSLCAPPRLYNQLTLLIAKQRGTTGMALARLLALVHVSLADTAIAAWESKYFYGFWRPIAGIRESDPGTGPSGLGDGNASTVGDPTFVPLGAPASNLAGPNFTPPFPAYPSGHASFGGALFQTLRRYYGTDAIAFSFTSDEFNGITRGNDGVVRPVVTRSFASLSAAEEENGQSRMYLGIHWGFDKTEGIKQGRNIANYVFDRLYPRLDR